MSERRAQANKVVRQYTKWAVVPGVLPFPYVDMAALFGVQLKMVSDLAKLYNVPFKKERARAIVSSVLGGVIPQLSTTGLFSTLGSTFKVIPGIGFLVGVATSTGVSTAITYALGMVFINQLESGETLESMDAGEMREGLSQEYEKAKSGKSPTVGKVGGKEPAPSPP
jgi:uncharacterized protein (DUF697 family)